MPAKLPDISTTAASNLQRLGTLLREQRKRLGVSATVAAESAGMSRITWYRIEQGNAADTMGAYMQALVVLRLELDVQQVSSDNSRVKLNKADWIPTDIALADYPQLQQLAWHVRGKEAFTLSPREALDIYERHGRHLDKTTMSPEERTLFTALHKIFGNSHGV